MIKTCQTRTADLLYRITELQNDLGEHGAADAAMLVGIARVALLERDAARGPHDGEAERPYLDRAA